MPPMARWRRAAFRSVGAIGPRRDPRRKVRPAPRSRPPASAAPGLRLPRSPSGVAQRRRPTRRRRSPSRQRGSLTETEGPRARSLGASGPSLVLALLPRGARVPILARRASHGRSLLVLLSPVGRRVRLRAAAAASPFRCIFSGPVGARLGGRPPRGKARAEPSISAARRWGRPDARNRRGLAVEKCQNSSSGTPDLVLPRRPRPAEVLVVVGAALEALARRSSPQRCPHPRG
jgi:hypothetical protein